MTTLIRVLAISLIAAPVKAKPRAGKAQSDVSAKWSQTLAGIAVNFN